MADDDLWDENTRQRLAAVRTKAMSPRPRVDQTLTAPETTPSVMRSDSFGSVSSTGPAERMAPLAGHADTARRRR